MRLDELPLLVQLHWGKDDREGRFLLKKENDKTILVESLSIYNTLYNASVLTDLVPSLSIYNTLYNAAVLTDLVPSLSIYDTLYNAAVLTDTIASALAHISWRFQLSTI